MQFICSITDLSPTICLLLRAASGNYDNGLFLQILFKNCAEITDFPQKIALLIKYYKGQRPVRGCGVGIDYTVPTKHRYK